MRSLRVAEVVGRGHPDRIADQIVDKIVDLVVAIDPKAKIGIEALISKEQLVVAGEIEATFVPSFEEGIRDLLQELGTSRDLPILFQLHTPSAEIARAADLGTFGDQAIVTGFATNEHPSFLPLPQALAKEALTLLEGIKGLKKDGKILLILEGEKSPHIKELRISWHAEDSTPPVDELRSLFFQKLPYLDKESTIFVHPFFQGGIDADTGISGRKIISEGYGVEVPNGGGALSGKDGGKIDRMGAYLCRLIAKSLVREKGYQWAEVTLAALFGERKPHFFEIWTDQGQLKTDLPLTKEEIFSLLRLGEPHYLQTAIKGPFGGSEFPWETLTLLP